MRIVPLGHGCACCEIESLVLTSHFNASWFNAKVATEKVKSRPKTTANVTPH